MTSICSTNKSRGVESPKTLSADLHNRSFSRTSIKLSNVEMMEENISHTHFEVQKEQTDLLILQNLTSRRLKDYGKHHENWKVQEEMVKTSAEMI